MKLLRVKTSYFNTDLAINPRYISSVGRGRQQFNGPDDIREVTVIEYEGHAGYRTRTCNVDEPFDSVVARIEALEP